MKLSLKAIVLGGVTDVVLSGILGLPFTIYVMRRIGKAGLSPENTSSAVAIAVHQSPGLYALQLLIGFGSSVVGGYVAARIAEQDKLKNAALASWLCVGISIYSLALGMSHVSLPLHAFLIAVTPAFYVAGAFLCRRGSNVTLEHA